MYTHYDATMTVAPRSIGDFEMFLVRCPRAISDMKKASNLEIFLHGKSSGMSSSRSMAIPYEIVINPKGRHLGRSEDFTDCEDGQYSRVSICPAGDTQ